MKNANKQKAKTKNKKRGNIITYQYFLIINSTEARTLISKCSYKKSVTSTIISKKIENSDDIYEQYLTTTSLVKLKTLLSKTLVMIKKSFQTCTSCCYDKDLFSAILRARSTLSEA